MLKGGLTKKIIPIVCESTNFFNFISFALKTVIGQLIHNLGILNAALTSIRKLLHVIWPVILDLLWQQKHLQHAEH